MQLVTPPDVEPVELEEAKLFLRVDSDDEDDLITSLITVARDCAERFTRRGFITQTWSLNLDAWPTAGFKLPLLPLQSIDEIVYVDSEGIEAEVDAETYDVDLDAGALDLTYAASWPSATLRPTAPITITFTIGYGDDAADVPEAIKTAIKLLVANLFENREPIVVGTITSQLPMSVESILWQYRNLEL